MLLHGILSGACSVTRRKQSNTSSRPVYLHGNFGVPSQQLDLARLTPTRRSSFAVWWKKAERKLQKHLRKGFNSFCILGAWIIWKHRIACVFDGSRHLTYRRLCRLLRMKRTLGSSSGPKGCLSSTSS